MACLQNGTTLLNNNNLSSFKHNIMKYDETHANVYTSQINNFLSNQIPFRNNHTKDKTQSDNNIFNKEERELEKEEAEEANEKVMHSCATSATKHKEDDNEVENERNRRTINNTTHKKQNDVVKTTKQTKQYQFFKSDCQSVNDGEVDNKADTVGLENNNKNTNTSLDVDNDDNSYQKEFPSDKGANEPAESGEPSHHARRPMNAFLIFCKRHRTIVKNRYPHLENRAVTKILGEWWAGLEPEDKACYTELAKQYKNAFFSANPNFKWYKLPAPPLRTLNTRPGNIVKSPPPPKDPQEVEERPQQLFTPGKLADETQLGSITSLINSNNQHGAIKTPQPLKIKSHSNDNTETINEDEQQPEVLSSPEPETEPDNYKNYLLSPPNSNLITMCQPAKPFKKRLVLSPQNDTIVTDTKNIVRSIFSTNENDAANKTDGNIFDSSLLQQALQSFVIDEAFEGDFNLDFRALNNNTNSNLTQQELINKVVDHMCSSKTDSNDSNADDMDDECNTCMQNQDESRETRKSVRSCKGLLYAKFMAEGKLFVSKRNRKNLTANATTTTTVTKLAKPSFASSTVSDKVPRNTEPIELSDTIKKLAERTIGSSAKTTTPTPTTANPYNVKTMDQDNQHNEIISLESREETMKKMFRAADFNLDEKIEALPSLSLDKFQQKKKENKKRKFLRASKMRDTVEPRKKISNTSTEPNSVRSESDDKNAVNLIGSRKRKPIGKPRKQSERANDDNKQNINNNNNNNSSNNNNNVDVDDTTTSTSEIDLFGLATLAEVAAKKAKIDQK